jgi:predicted RNA-binding protein YlxR (DUF448 family)
MQGKRAGRGAYLCSKLPCCEMALEPGRLSRALKCQVSAAEVTALKASILALIEETAAESEIAPTDGASVQR